MFKCIRMDVIGKGLHELSTAATNARLPWVTCTNVNAKRTLAPELLVTLAQAALTSNTSPINLQTSDS